MLSACIQRDKKVFVRVVEGERLRCVSRGKRGRVCVRVRVCVCIKIGDFLVRVAGLGISLGSD